MTKIPEITRYGFHPVANIFPIMKGKEFDDLVNDIKVHGLREPIWLYNDQIIDGRNRYLACQRLGMEPDANKYDGDEDDLLSFVISRNLHRRHLNPSQLAMVAAEIAKMRQGARTDLSPIGERSQADAAEMLNIGKRSVERASKVRDSGSPELVKAVESGKVSVSAAAVITSLSKKEQTEIVARGEKEILEKAKEIRAEKGTDRSKWSNVVVRNVLSKKVIRTVTGTRLDKQVYWNFLVSLTNSGTKEADLLAKIKTDLESTESATKLAGPSIADISNKHRQALMEDWCLANKEDRKWFRNYIDRITPESAP